MTVEKDWITKAGLRAVVIATEMGHRCGYVGLPESSKLYGVHYNNELLDAIDVHGGLTFSELAGKYPIESSLFWFGFDCNHSGDAKDPEIASEEYLKLFEKYRVLGNYSGTVRDLAFCERECEQLATQLAAIESGENYSPTAQREWVEVTAAQILRDAHAIDDNEWDDLYCKDCWHKGFMEGAKYANEILKEKNT